MKILFIISMLIVVGDCIYAQSGALTINNQQNPCGVHVLLYAKDASSTPAAGYCDIATKTLYVPAYTTLVYTSVWNYETTTGWLSIPSGSVSLSTTDFTWTDATFQFNCPLPLPPGCSDGGSTISNDNTGLSCANRPSTWSAWCRNASFSPTPSSALDDVTISFW
jgi:hypothetical protein